MKAEEINGMIANIHEGQVINVVNADRNKRIVIWSIFLLLTFMLSWQQGLIKPSFDDNKMVNVSGGENNATTTVESTKSILLN